MNPQMLRQALWTLLNRPEQLNPGSAAEISLALNNHDPHQQDIASEILRNAVLERLEVVEMNRRPA